MISANLRNFRSKKGISQDRLSKLCDLSLNTIVKVESGKNPNPTIRTLMRIAKSLHVKVDDLVKVIAFVFFVLSFTPRPYAEEAAALPQEAKGRLVTISEGIAMVMKDSRLVKISLLDDEQARQDSLLARSALLPHLQVDAAKTYFKFQPASKFGAQRINTAEKEPFSYGFDVYQTLFDFGKSLSNYRAAQEIVKAHKANTEGIKRLATLEFIVAYFDLLEAER